MMLFFGGFVRFGGVRKFDYIIFIDGELIEYMFIVDVVNKCCGLKGIFLVVDLCLGDEVLCCVEMMRNVVLIVLVEGYL